MKDLSFFQLKNVMGAKMRKGFKSFCNNDTSTSTLNYQTAASARPALSSPNYAMDTSDVILNERGGGSQTTLEEMLLQLDMEEKMAKLNQYGPHVRHRMSCVNSSDILRTARNALNQYPRFSLDGKDAMYRSSFRDMSPLLNTARNCNRKMDMKSSQTQNMPPTIAGERVIWCKPGVVAKLMGLEAMPISMHRKHKKDTIMSAVIKRQSLRKRAERYEMEKKRSSRGTTGCGGRNSREMNQNSCSRNGNCAMKPVAMDLQEVGWPMRGGVLYRNNDAM
ncbi:hypothetical protein KY290_024711 [Solanum tuberosum]|uniref:DUF3741 domain-containing protein n=1 Tax=Solanum tuberosum TaxID=4113 RepID=A0ABQ7URF4_SOLTU|nr:hypothetical protein KY284_025582 [Solanum tuberosum]KAH0754441.1 hypothetical protein KY290_024711 [Solanum tuberosum]